MNCPQAKRYIRDTASDLLKPRRAAEVTAHTANCASCRELLAYEQRLVKEIDLALVEVVDCEPSAEFSARVRARLAQEGELRSFPVIEAWAWWPAFAVGIAALIVMFAFGWSRKRPRSLPVTVTATASPIPLAQPATNEKRADISASSHSAPVRRSRQNRTMQSSGLESRGSGQALDTQVLVQPDQWAAIAQLSRSLQPRPGFVRNSNPQKLAEAAQLIQIEPIKLESINVEPIEIKQVVIDSNF